MKTAHTTNELTGKPMTAVLLEAGDAYGLAMGGERRVADKPMVEFYLGDWFTGGRYYVSTLDAAAYREARPGVMIATQSLGDPGVSISGPALRTVLQTLCGRELPRLVDL